MSEFEIIERYFRHSFGSKDVILGSGDDAAIVRPSPGFDIVVTVDTLVEGIHFYSDTNPKTLGHKALAVNLSDLAAMGAEPKWITMALTQPEANTPWLEAFADGFFHLAQTNNVELIGGDLTQGPLSITVQAMGLVPQNKGLQRSGAREKDGIYVSGTIGDAAAALFARNHHFTPAKEDRDYFNRRLQLPQPRVSLGSRLQDMATAAIDISDGLLADLTHILQSSDVKGASLEEAAIPLSEAYRRYLGKGLDMETALTSGDDYELCFTISPENAGSIKSIESEVGIAITQIGIIENEPVENEPGIRIKRCDGSEWMATRTGYRHF